MHVDDVGQAAQFAQVAQCAASLDARFDGDQEEERGADQEDVVQRGLEDLDQLARVVERGRQPGSGHQLEQDAQDERDDEPGADAQRQVGARDVVEPGHGGAADPTDVGRDAAESAAGEALFDALAQPVDRADDLTGIEAQRLQPLRLHRGIGLVVVGGPDDKIQRVERAGREGAPTRCEGCGTVRAVLRPCFGPCMRAALSDASRHDTGWKGGSRSCQLRSLSPCRAWWSTARSPAPRPPAARVPPSCAGSTGSWNSRVSTSF